MENNLNDVSERKSQRLYSGSILKIIKTHISKDTDYAGGVPLNNFYECEKLEIPAWKGVLIRLSDKISRYKNVKLNTPEVDESLKDTLLDVSVYSLITILLTKYYDQSLPSLAGERKDFIGLTGELLEHLIEYPSLKLEDSWDRILDLYKTYIEIIQEGNEIYKVSLYDKFKDPLLTLAASAIATTFIKEQ